MTEKATEKDPALKVAKHRLSVLEMAKAIGNVSEACRRSGMDRTSFYEWKRRFQTQGIAGLQDQPPIPKHQPNATPPELEAQVLEASLEHPTWGCVKLSDPLKMQGISISSPTIQKIFIRNGMASIYDRLLLLEKKHLEEGMELSARADRQN